MPATPCLVERDHASDAAAARADAWSRGGRRRWRLPGFGLGLGLRAVEQQCLDEELDGDAIVAGEHLGDLENGFVQSE
jgi:hypothetical protein